MNLLRKIAGALALLALVTSGAAFAQPAYPTQNPTYIPNGFLAASTVTTTGVTGIFTNQGLGTMTLNLSGTATTIAGSLQGSNDLPATGVTQTWKSLELFPVGGQGLAPTRTFSAFGTYRVNIAGFAQVRVNFTTVTGGNIRVQEVASPGPYTPVAGVNDLGAVLTNTAQAAATVVTADFSNALNKGLLCVFNQASHTGSPSTTFSIQYKDTASAAYITLLTSGAITSDTTPTSLVIYPGGVVTANVAGSSSLPGTWRISETVGGTGSPTITGTINCTMLP